MKNAKNVDQTLMLLNRLNKLVGDYNGHHFDFTKSDGKIHRGSFVLNTHDYKAFEELKKLNEEHPDLTIDGLKKYVSDYKLRGLLDIASTYEGHQFVEFLEKNKLVKRNDRIQSLSKIVSIITEGIKNDLKKYKCRMYNKYLIARNEKDTKSMTSEERSKYRSQTMKNILKSIPSYMFEEVIDQLLKGHDTNTILVAFMKKFTKDNKLEPKNSVDKLVIDFMKSYKPNETEIKFNLIFKGTPKEQQQDSRIRYDKEILKVFAKYYKQIYTFCKFYEDHTPTDEQIETYSEKRELFNEFVAGFDEMIKSIETATTKQNEMFVKALYDIIVTMSLTTGSTIEYEFNNIMRIINPSKSFRSSFKDAITQGKFDEKEFAYKHIDEIDDRFEKATDSYIKKYKEVGRLRSDGEKKQDPKYSVVLGIAFIEYVKEFCDKLSFKYPNKNEFKIYVE